MTLAGYLIGDKASIDMDLIRPKNHEDNAEFEITMLIRTNAVNSAFSLKSDKDTLLKDYMIMEKGFKIISFKYKNGFVIDTEPIDDSSRLFLEIKNGSNPINLIAIVYKITSDVIPFISKGNSICFNGYFYSNDNGACLKCTQLFVKECQNTVTCSPSSMNWNSGEICAKFDYFDFSRMEPSDLELEVRPAKLYNLTIDFWIFIKKPADIQSNALKIIYKDFITIGITSLDVYQSRVDCIPLEYNYSMNEFKTKKDYLSQVNELQDVVMTQNTSGKQFTWSYVKCAFSLKSHEGYISIDSNPIDIKSYQNLSKWQGNPNFGSEYNPLDRKFYTSDSMTKLILQNFKGVSTELYLKNLSILNVYMPYSNNYDWRYYNINDENRYFPMIASITFKNAQYNYSDPKLVNANEIIVEGIDSLNGYTTTFVPISGVSNFASPSLNFRRLPFLDPNYKYKNSSLLEAVALANPQNAKICGEYKDKISILACQSDKPYLSSDLLNCLSVCDAGFFRNTITYNGHFSFFCNNTCPGNADTCPKDVGSDDIKPLQPNLKCSEGFIKADLNCVQDEVNNTKNTALQFSNFYNTPGILIDLKQKMTNFSIDVWFYPDLFLLKKASSINDAFQNKRFFLTNAFSIEYRKEDDGTNSNVLSILESNKEFKMKESIHEGWTHLVINATSTSIAFTTEKNHDHFSLTEPLSFQFIYFCNLEYDKDQSDQICDKLWIDAYYSNLKIVNSITANNASSKLYYFKFDLPSLNENMILSSDNSIRGVADYLNKFINHDNILLYNIGNNYSADQFNPNLRLFKSLAESSTKQIQLSEQSNCHEYCSICFGEGQSECYECEDGNVLLDKSICNHDSNSSSSNNSSSDNNSSSSSASADNSNQQDDNNSTTAASLDISPDFGFTSLTTFNFKFIDNKSHNEEMTYDFRYIEAASIPVSNPKQLATAEDLQISEDELIIDSKSTLPQVSYVFPQFSDAKKKIYTIKCRVKSGLNILYGIALTVEVNSSLISLDDTYNIMLKNQSASDLLKSFKTDNTKTIFDLFVILSYNMMPIPTPDSACDSSFCNKNGNCFPNSPSKFCTCNSGFYGPNCTIVEGDQNKLNYILTAFISWLNKNASTLITKDSINDFTDNLNIFAYNFLLLKDHNRSSDFVAEFEGLLESILKQFPTLLQEKQANILSIYNNLIKITATSTQDGKPEFDYNFFNNKLVVPAKLIALNITQQTGSVFNFSQLSTERYSKLNLISNSQNFSNKDSLDLQQSIQGLVFTKARIKDLVSIDVAFGIELGSNCTNELSDNLMVIYTSFSINTTTLEKILFSIDLIDLDKKAIVDFFKCQTKMNIKKDLSSKMSVNSYNCGSNALVTQSNNTLLISLPLTPIIELDCSYTITSRIIRNPEFYSDFSYYGSRAIYGNVFFIVFFSVVFLTFLYVFVLKSKTPSLELYCKRIIKSVFPYFMNEISHPISSFGTNIHQIEMNNQFNSPEKGIRQNMEKQIDVPSASENLNDEDIKSNSLINELKNTQPKHVEPPKSSERPIHTQLEVTNNPYFDQFQIYSFKNLREILKSCSSISACKFFTINMKERNALFSLLANTSFARNIFSIILQLLVFISMIGFIPFVSAILIAKDDKITSDDETDSHILFQKIIITSLLSSIYSWIVISLTSISISSLFNLNAKIHNKSNEEILNEINRYRSGLAHDLAFSIIFIFVILVEFHFGFTFVNSFTDLRGTFAMIIIVSYLMEHLIYELILQAFSVILFKCRQSSPCMLNVLTFLERYRKPKVTAI